MPTAANPDPPVAETSAEGDDILCFPAAMAQEAFYFLERLRPGATPFNIAVRFRIEGEVDLTLIERAMNEIVARHESLRTHFEEEDGELLQVVQPEAHIDFGVVDLSEFEPDEREARLLKCGLREACLPFDLQKAPLIRAVAAVLSRVEHVLHITVHHTVADGWSIGVLTEEITALYDAFKSGEGSPLEPLPIQYADYAVWQRDFISGPDVASQLEYWKNKLKGYAELDLPTDRPRPPVKTWNGDIVSELLPSELTDRLAIIAQKNGATLFHVFMAAFNILLQRYTGSDDLVIGTPVTGRSRPEMEPLIGAFINTVLLRTDLSGDPDFHRVLQRTRDTALEAIAHQDLPFEFLVRELRPERDSSRNPLFQINFTHQKAFIKPTSAGQLKLNGIPSLSPGAIYDIHFFMVERDNVWRASCDFSTDLFDRETAVRLVGHFRTLLQGIAHTPDLPIGRLSMIGGEEWRQIFEWSGRTTPYPRDKALGPLFLETAERYADRPALVQSSRSITYRQLRANAVLVAQKLRDYAVHPGQRVGLAADSSPEMIAGLLGIVLAGAVYVPIDADDPKDRICFLIDDAKVDVVVADAACATACEGMGRNLLVLDPLDVFATPMDFQSPPTRPTDPVYLLYTSGSTGTPKGVVVPHRGVARLVRDTDFMEFRPDEVFLQAAPLGFDASTFEIWGPLLNGGSLVLPPMDSPGLADIAALVRDYKVTTLWLTAGLFQVMVDDHLEDLAGLRHLLAGGDVLPATQVRQVLKRFPGVQLINGYGPTENTTFTACHTVEAADLEKSSIPIGRPIANTFIRILDRDGRTAPIGVHGEIITGGAGLALEYLNNKALTAEKFMMRDGERFYRTGDLGRWRMDGTIEFFGRIDQQVKVRGYRIEPGEVEAVVQSHPAVGQCKVAVRGETVGEKILVAWVKPVSVAKVDVPELKKYLAERLPAHLRPDAIVLLNMMPLTSSGKIDTKALPSPSKAAPVRTEAPQSPTEKHLAIFWQELLGVHSVGRDDDFFNLGGHSLMGLRLFSRIRGTFGLSLPLATLLSAPTIRSLGALIDKELTGEGDGDEEAVIAAVQSRGHLPPFFCVHGGDGGVIFYRNLAEHLSKDRPFLAIEAAALSSSGSIEIDSVENMAVRYLRLIRRRQPYGPYHLGGYSFGGVVAYEMSRILEEEGESVAFLALFDTMSPTVSSSPFNFAERMTKFWQAQGDAPLGTKMKRLGWRYCARLADRIHDKTGLFPTRANTPAEAHTDRRAAQLCDAHLKVMRAYEPMSYKGHLTLFKTPSVDDIFEYPDDYGWAEYVGSMEIVVVPGHHLTLFDPENVGNLGREVRERLEPRDD